MKKAFIFRAGSAAGALLLAAVALDIATPNLALAQGFDCTKASSSAEKMICANASLSTSDDTLTRLYQWTVEESPANLKPKIVADQKNWITQTRDACKTADCLSDAYGARITQLSTISMDGGGSATYVGDAVKIASITEQMRKDLHESGFSKQVGQCSHIVSLDSHPLSYGAFCSFGNKQSIEVCDENMFGNLAVNFSFERTGRSLAGFTQAACPGG